MDLKNLGWNEEFADKYNQIKDRADLLPARVIAEYKNMFKLYSEKGKIMGEITGKMRFNNKFPAVGDWVIISLQPGEERAVIYGILPRKSKFSRKIAGKETREQVIAANMDYVFIVTSLNEDFNLRRIERYLTIAWDSGTNPVVILSKADLCENVTDKRKEVENITFGVPVHIISSITGTGLQELNTYFKQGKTAVLLGSSGVGKSTLINAITGESRQEVQEIRESDGKGRHTTTIRELILLQDGGMIIDTPGMREIQIWEGAEGIKDSFSDIEELAQNCYFNDCQHNSEPDCAVKKAIEDGIITEERLNNYRKMQRELKYIELKKKKGAKAIERYKMKEIYGK